MKTVIVQLDRAGETGLRSEAFPSLRDQRINRVIAVVLIVAPIWLLVRPAASGWQQEMYPLLIAGMAVVLGHKLFRPGLFQPGSLRVSTTHTPLLLAPSGGGRVVVWVFAGIVGVWGCSATVLAVQTYARDPASFTFFSLPRSAWVAVILLVSFVVFAIRSLAQSGRAASGLELSDWGVVAAGEGRIARIAWRELRRATIEPHRRHGPELVLIDQQGAAAVRMPTRICESDPMLVAALIHFYRDHPEERNLLATPERAVERFRASLI